MSFLDSLLLWIFYNAGRHGNFEGNPVTITLNAIMVSYQYRQYACIVSLHYGEYHIIIFTITVI